MQYPSDFFAEFPPVSREAWLERIAKDLKNNTLDDLYWQTDGLKIDPFGHADDFPEPPAPLSAAAKGWEISEDILVSDPAEANREAIQALEGGAEGLQFHLSRLDSADLEQLLEGIYLDYIGLHFSADNWAAVPPGALLAQLGGLAAAKGIPGASLHGSIGYDPLSTPGIKDWRYLADLITYAREHYPGFQIVRVHIPAGETVIEDLAALLHQANTYFEKLHAFGISPADTAAQIRFSIRVGKSYFLEIAKLRAFKMLWFNVLKGWGIPLTDPVLDVHFNPGVYTDDLYTNMIRATTMAMSAVLGGATRLTVLPYDAGREEQSVYPRAFARRIARNVQHLLKLESGFDQLADPAAGSYYTEKMSRQIAEATWNLFRSSKG